MSDPALARRQIGLLVACQALLYLNNVTLIAVNGLAGLALAPTPLLATLPITCYVVGSAPTPMPASLAMGRPAASGALVAGSRWTDLNLYAAPFVAIAAGALLYLLLQARGRPVAA